MISAHQSAQGVPPTSSAAATATAAAAAEEAKYAILQLLFIPGRKMKYNVPCVEGKKTRMHICGAVAQGAPQRMQEPIRNHILGRFATNSQITERHWERGRGERRQFLCHLKRNIQLLFGFGLSYTVDHKGLLGC